MRKIIPAIVIVVSGVLIWPFLAYFYYGLPEGSYLKETGRTLAHQLQVLNLSSNLLSWSDEIVFTIFSLIYREQAIYLSDKEISLLEQAVNEASSKDIFSEEVTVGLGEIWYKLDGNRLWLPKFENDYLVWTKMAGELRRLQRGSRQLFIELAKRRVSVLITVNPADRNIWLIEFPSEVMFPVTLQSIRIISDSNKVLYLSEVQANQRRLMKEESFGAYIADGEINRQLMPLILSGEAEGILDVQVTFQNMVTQVDFSPRAVRYIDSHDQI